MPGLSAGGLYRTAREEKNNTTEATSMAALMRILYWIRSAGAAGAEENDRNQEKRRA